MKRKITYLMAALMIGATLYSCKPNDGKIKEQVEVLLTAVPGINADVKGGVVTLTGTVASEDVKNGLNTLLANIDGIKSVTNNVTVEIPKALEKNPDELLNQMISTALAAYPTVKASVANGVVTLTGDLKRVDLKKVMQLVNEAKPTKVENKINLK